MLRFAPEGSGKKPTVVTVSTPRSNSIEPEPKEGLDDIRNWNQSAHGVNAERLRNCIVYHLDYVQNSWYADKLTPAALGREGFVTKLDADTPLGWTPATANVKRIKPLPVDYAEWAITGPGINQPLRGWDSGRQKMDNTKRAWYGKGWENQPDPIDAERLEQLFTRYQAGLGINTVGNDD